MMKQIYKTNIKNKYKLALKINIQFMLNKYK